MTQPAPAPPTDLLTMDEAAAILRLRNRKAARLLAASGAFPGAFKAKGGGNFWLVPRSGVDAYVRAQQAAAQPAPPAAPADGRARRRSPRAA